MAIGFTLTKFVVIQSLEPTEAETGRATYEFLQALVSEYEPDLHVQLHEVRSSLEFSDQLRALANEAAVLGHRPLLHIECHGSRQTGLWFADGTSIAWDSLGTLLAKINVATEFNLVVAVSACYGAYLAGQFSVTTPAPAFAIVAPTDAVYDYEVLQGFRHFYAHLLRTGDAGASVRALTQLDLDSGSWFSELAETWYERLIVTYAETHLNAAALRNWAKDLSRRQRAQGIRAGVGSTLRQLKTRHRADLTGKYFDQFFSVAAVPSCSQRFAPVRARVGRRIGELQTQGRIAL